MDMNKFADILADALNDKLDDNVDYSSSIHEDEIVFDIMYEDGKDIKITIEENHS